MFDINEVKSKSGDRFNPGKALYESGSVSSLTFEGAGVTAFVRGQQTYKVTLNHQENEISNTCSCPAASYQPFCKHCVCVAIAANYAAVSGEIETEHVLARWFSEKPKDELVAILMGIIEEDDHHFQKWMLKYKASNCAITFSELSKLITKALPKKNLWNRHEVSSYFMNAEEVLDSVYAVMQQLKPEERWKLILHTFKRLNEVLERIDDSGGNRFFLEDSLYKEMANAFFLLPWSDQKKAEWLIDMLISDTSISPRIPEDFILTDSLRSLFYQYCESALDEKECTEGEKAYYCAQILIKQANQQGNWHQLIKIKAKIATRCHDYLELAKICLNHDEELDAEDWLIRAKKSSSGNYEKTQCQKLEVDVKIAMEETDEAWNLAWDLFSNNPSYNNYLSLIKIAKRCDVSPNRYLEEVERLLKSFHKDHQNGRMFSYHADSLLNFYIHTGKLEQACSWASAHTVGAGSLLDLSEKLSENQPLKAFEFYHRALTVILSQANKQAYHEAIDILLQIHEKLGQNKEAFSCLVKTLLKENNRKRNLVALLEKHFQVHLEVRGFS